MNIGIDIDDTISETYATLLEYAQKYTIEELKRSPIIKSFNTEDHYILKICTIGMKMKQQDFGKIL